MKMLVMAMRARRVARKHITTLVAIEKLRVLIMSYDYKCRSRVRAEDFTRERKMSFVQIIFFMLNMVKQSTQTALDNFFDLLNNGDTHMSQQSFSEARQKLKWEACRELVDSTVKSVYNCDYDTWHGYRVWAVDGTKIQLPSDPELLKLFGSTGRGSTAATAQSSCLYDVLNDIIADAHLENMATDERTLAVKHLDFLAKMDSFSKELMTVDRGYASFSLIEKFISVDVRFLMRIKTKWNCDIDNLPLGDHHFVLKKDDKEIPLRVLKFELDSGEIETLITDLYDKRMGENAFKQLYFKRWPIETKYGELKLKFEIENFSGRTKQVILQDYFISICISNLVAIAANELKPVIDEIHAEKENIYEYKVNKNHAVGVFKDRFISALLEQSPRKRASAVSKILQLITYHVTPVRPDRSVPRNANPRDARFHHNRKSNC